MKKVRYGIIGIGKMGFTHARKLFKGLDKNGCVTAVCDLEQEKLDRAQAELKGVKTFLNYKELIKCADVDAVVVATPHYDHPAIGLEVIEAGKHLLIEKPAGVYTKAVRELNEAAAKKPNLVFGIMYNQRTNPLYIKAKEIIESGQMGEIKRVNWIITN